MQDSSLQVQYSLVEMTYAQLGSDIFLLHWYLVTPIRPFHEFYFWVVSVLNTWVSMVSILLNDRLKLWQQLFQIHNSEKLVFEHCVFDSGVLSISY